jgi:hypothetical protein
MRIFLRTTQSLVCFAAILLLLPTASPAQQTVPTPAPQVTPPVPPPAPPEKKKKKKKDPPAATPDPAGAVETYAITIRAETFGQGGVSDVSVRISAASGPGSSVSGQTNYSGEFETKLPAGDYDISLEQGSVSIRQSIHVDQSSNKLFLMNFPAPAPMGGPPR